jgi:hypothetical protein
LNVACLASRFAKEVAVDASISPIEFRTRPAPSRSEAGSVAASVRGLLRLEGLAAFAAAVGMYAHAGFSWPLLALLFLAPDLSMLAYLGGPRAGAIGYNFAHTHALPLVLTLAGFTGGVSAAAAGGLIWIAHIGFDRMLGYGLKYSTGFGNTHLGHLGRR